MLTDKERAMRQWRRDTKRAEKGATMTATIQVNMDNAAFEECPTTELARILRKLAKELDAGEVDFADGRLLRDINGNSVGEFRVQ